jgi:hypothetical protein
MGNKTMASKQVALSEISETPLDVIKQASFVALSASNSTHIFPSHEYQMLMNTTLTDCHNEHLALFTAEMKQALTERDPLSCKVLLDYMIKKLKHDPLWKMQ